MSLRWCGGEHALDLDDGYGSRDRRRRTSPDVDDSEMVVAAARRPVSQISEHPKRDRSPALVLSAHDHARLVTWSKSRTLAARVVMRSRMVLLLARGATVATIATELRVARATVRLWRGRFLEHGPEGLLRDARGRGRKPALSQAVREALQREAALSDTLTLRERARQLGVSASTVSRWRRPVE